MKDKVYDYYMRLGIWDFLLSFPKEYRKSNLRRLERRIHNQRTQIKIMEREWSKALAHEAFFMNELHKCKHKGKGLQCS